MRTFFLSSFCHKKRDCWELGVFLTLGSRLEGLAFACWTKSAYLSPALFKSERGFLAGISHVRYNALLMAVNKEKTAVQKQLENDILLSYLPDCIHLLLASSFYWVLLVVLDKM
jgi:hypothetical protein